jgi:gluconokinase
VLGSDGCAVLACSALRHSYREALVPPGAPAGAVRFVHLEVSPPVLADRLQERVGHFAPLTLLDSQLATLETPDATEPALRVDGERPVPELVATIVAALGR